MKYITQFVLAMALFGCGAAAPGLRASPGDALERLAWMSGVWLSDGEERSIELWLPPEGGMMNGLARTTQNGQTVFHEALRIEARNGGAIAYVVSPSGQEGAEFMLVSTDGRRATFENLEHDYPQRIVYERDGDRMVARIELANGERAQSWTYTRSSLQ
jgi:hypothetical protein